MWVPEHAKGFLTSVFIAQRITDFVDRAIYLMNKRLKVAHRQINQLDSD